MHGIYSIGNLSDRSGVNAETIRYYEKVELLPTPSRASNGYRQYDDTSLERLGFIRRSRELGFTVDEIRELLELAHHPERPCSDADKMTRAHLDDIEGKLRDLRRMRRVLTQVVDCTGQTVEHCELLRTLAKPTARSKP